MALIDVYNLSKSSDLRNRTLAAMWKSAEDVRNEDAGTANHAERVALTKIWAGAKEEDAAVWDVFRFVIGNATIQAAGEAAEDNDILFVVNSVIDHLAI